LYNIQTVFGLNLFHICENSGAIILAVFGNFEIANSGALLQNKLMMWGPGFPCKLKTSKMNSDVIRVEKDGNICDVILNRPEKLNVFDEHMFLEVGRIFRQIRYFPLFFVISSK
jgi:hypothetical protein